jgi:hypothetical protein
MKRSTHNKTLPPISYGDAFVPLLIELFNQYDDAQQLDSIKDVLDQLFRYSRDLLSPHLASYQIQKKFIQHWQKKMFTNYLNHLYFCFEEFNRNGPKPLLTDNLDILKDFEDDEFIQKTQEFDFSNHLELSGDLNAISTNDYLFKLFRFIYVYFNEHQIDFNQTIQIYQCIFKFIKHVPGIIPFHMSLYRWLSEQLPLNMNQLFLDLQQKEFKETNIAGNQELSPTDDFEEVMSNLLPFIRLSPHHKEFLKKITHKSFETLPQEGFIINCKYVTDENFDYWWKDLCFIQYYFDDSNILKLKVFKEPFIAIAPPTLADIVNMGVLEEDKPLGKVEEYSVDSGQF